MTFRDFAFSLIDFFNKGIIPLLMALMLLVFIWGIVQYFFIKREDPAARTEGAQFMMWGVIGFAVVASMWGIVNLVLNTFGV